MVDNTTVEVGVDKSTENYEVYESADEETIVGMYVSDGAAEALGEFASAEFADEPADEPSEAPIALEKNKDTASYGVYETAGGAISGIYVSHDLLESEENDEGEREAPETIGITMSPSDEDSFESAAGVDETEEEALVAGASDESDDSDEEEVEIADEEVGLVDGE